MIVPGDSRCRSSITVLHGKEAEIKKKNTRVHISQPMPIIEDLYLYGHGTAKEETR